MTPIDIKPSPCPLQAPHGSACKILQLYVATFQSKVRADAKATLSYLVDMSMMAAMTSFHAVKCCHLVSEHGGLPRPQGSSICQFLVYNAFVLVWIV